MAEKKNYIQLGDRQTKALKIPPHSIEAEQSVLGSLMLENNRWEKIVDKLVTSDFFSHPHRIIFNEMHRLIEKNQPIDLITLSEALNQKGQLEPVGGFAYLAELSKNTPSAANINAYADIVRDRALVRDMISVAHKISEDCYDPQGRSTEYLLDLSESRVFQIADKRSREAGPKGIEQILESTLTRIESIYRNPYNVVTGISTGYHDLDQKTSGLQKSDLIIIAARPSMGKTTFAMNICENAALIQDKPVLIFSLEMPQDQIMMRMLASLSRIDHSRLRTGQLANDEWIRISGAINVLLEKRNMYIDDSSSLTPTEIRSRARRIFREQKGLSLIMIDYLQLMRVPALYENRTLEISEISRSLKALAKELQVPVVALSQLNRLLEQRTNKRPVNSDLRESGSIEQDADLIMFIYRDEVYNENSDNKGIAEIILGKQRNGPIGSLKLRFNGQWSRFDNYAELPDY
ncbi:MAG: replicative DNA helicase [Candidatus Dasytiphilus stammeri]